MTEYIVYPKYDNIIRFRLHKAVAEKNNKHNAFVKNAFLDSYESRKAYRSVQKQVVRLKLNSE